MGLTERHRVWPKMQMPRSSLGSQCVKLKIVYLTIDRRRRWFYRAGRDLPVLRWLGQVLPVLQPVPPCIWTSQTRTSLFLESVQLGRDSSSFACAKTGRHCSSILLRRWWYSFFGLHVVFACTVKIYLVQRATQAAYFERCKDFGRRGESLRGSIKKSLILSRSSYPIRI